MKVLYKLILSFWVCVTRHAQGTQSKKFAYLCNISKKAWGLKLIFCLQINTKVFYKMIVSLWVCVTRHAQSIQNKNFAISLQYLKKNVKDEVIFLPADKRQKFLQIFARYVQITQNNKFAISLQYLHREVKDKVNCFHADKHESLLQTDTMILMGKIKHSQSSQNSKFVMSM